MKNIEHLRADLYKHTGRAKQIIYQAQAEGRQPTEEERKEIDEANGAAKRLEQEIEAAEREQEEASRNAVPAGNSPFSYPQQTQTNKGTGPEYRSVFGLPQVLDNAGFRSFGEYLQSIESGRLDSRLQKLDTRQMNIGAGADGGFAVPVEFAQWLVDGSLEDEIIRPRANVFPMASKTRKVPAWDNLDRSGGNLYGGIKAEWTPELTERTDQEPKLREITLEAEKLILYVSASREAIQDAQELETQLTAAMRKALSYEMDRSFIAGSGNGEPRGILNDPALLAVNRAEADKIGYTDLLNMYAKLVKEGRGIWIANHSVLPQLMSMQVGDHLVWQPNARDGSPGQLLGMPVLMTDKTPALGGKGDLLLVEPSRYMVGMRQEIVLDTSLAPGWHKDYTSWRCVLRVAGQGAWDKPLTVADGTTQMSWAIALDEPA